MIFASRGRKLNIRRLVLFGGMRAFVSKKGVWFVVVKYFNRGARWPLPPVSLAVS